MDALTAAKSRIDRAMNEIEAKLHALQARVANSSVADDDLFAPLPSNAADRARIAELQEAGQEAAEALNAAAGAVREVLNQQAGQSAKAEEKEA